MRTKSLVFLAALPALLLVAGCAPAVNLAGGPSASASAGGETSAPTPSPTPTPTTPPVITAADYLVGGTPNVPDKNGEWYGEYAFYTDASKSVWCDIVIFSGDGPGASCSIVPAARSQVTYTLPAGSSANCSTHSWDGYTLGLAARVDDLIPKDAGWDGCEVGAVGGGPIPAITKVLPDSATLTISPFTCTTNAGVANCTYNDSGSPLASITMGLHTASFHSN